MTGETFSCVRCHKDRQLLSLPMPGPTGEEIRERVCIDCWAEWQAANPGQNPTLTGTAAIMDPWTDTEADTRDITALGYTYL